MRARDLVSDFPTVRMDLPAVEAARLLAARNLPGLVVIDDEGKPETILAGTQVMRMAVPSYCQDDPIVARVIDEDHADLFLNELGDRTVREVLPEQPRELPVVEFDASVLEIAALMARTRTPLVAVVDEQGTMTGAITLDALLDRMLGT